MLDKLKHHLKARGSSVTPARLAIFTYLQAHDRAPIKDIVAAHPQLDQASVYRTIALFKELGVAQDVISGGRKLIELTDTFDSHHHHISCSQCGLSVAVEDPKLERYLAQVAVANGVTPQSHQIEITGLCQACSSLKAQSAN